MKTGSTWLAKLKGPTLALGISVFPFSAQADSTSVSVFNAEAYTTGNSSSLLFPITRAGDTSYDVLLRYHTVDMTAVAGTNYTAAAGTLTLPAGVTSSSASVVIAADPTPGSGQKTFQFVIDSATGFGPAVDFASPQTLLPGWFPSFVSAADLNGDGKPDLIVANTGANLVAVMLNTTAPGSTTLSFATYQIFATGSNPDAVAVADINGDGRPDIVVANFADNTISVLLNTTTAGNSVPSFASAQSFDAGSNPTSIAVVDANADGRPDVIVANQGDDAVSVLRNSTLIGSAVAEFAARQVFAVGSQPSSVVAANVNGDGRPDVVVSNYNDDTVSVLLNTTGAGATSFAFTTQQTFVTGANPAAVAAADINGDGTIDLIVANSGSDTIAVLLNETPPGALAAAFLPQQSFTSGTGPQSIMTRDLNGDGKSDLVVANYGDGTLSVLRNVTAARSSEVTFEQPETFDTQSAPVHVVLADLNSDGRDELVVANSDATILRNVTSASPSLPTFEMQEVFGTVGPYNVAAADLNGDGEVDLAIANDYGEGLSILKNTSPGGEATFAPQQTVATDACTCYVVAADVSLDGKPDLIVASANGHTLSVLTNTTAPNSATSFTSQQIYYSPGGTQIAAAAADINGDGKPDLVVSDGGGARHIHLFANTTQPGHPVTFAPPQSVTVGLGPSAIAFADVNGDGKPDMIVTNSQDDTVSVLLNATEPGSSALTFALHQDFATGSTPYSIAVSDLNTDGKPDIIVANDLDSVVSILLNQTPTGGSTPVFAAQQTITTGSSARFVDASDIDGDGKPDLVVANYSDNNVALFLNTMTPGSMKISFGPEQTFATGASPIWVGLLDVNGDGKPDVVAANNSDATISVLMNSQFRVLVEGNPAVGIIAHDEVFSNGFD